MKNKIKSYLVFTSLLYRIVVYLVMPIFAAGIALWCRSSFATVVLASVLLPAFEVVSDQWLFGGIQTKDMEKIDYLKTSGRGMKVMKSALSLDLVRKFLSAALVMGICFLNAPGIINGEISGWALQVLLYSIAVSWCFSVLGTFLARYGSMLWFSMLTAYGMIILESICWGLFFSIASKYGWIYGLLFTALGILLSILAVKTAMKNVEGSYYDK